MMVVETWCCLFDVPSNNSAKPAKRHLAKIHIIHDMDANHTLLPILSHGAKASMAWKTSDLNREVSDLFHD